MYFYQTLRIREAVCHRWPSDNRRSRLSKGWLTSMIHFCLLTEINKWWKQYFVHEYHIGDDHCLVCWWPVEEVLLRLSFRYSSTEADLVGGWCSIQWQRCFREATIYIYIRAKTMQLPERHVNCLNTYLCHKMDIILTRVIYKNTLCLNDRHPTYS